MLRSSVIPSLAAAAIFCVAASAQTSVYTGKDAFRDWNQQKPGNRVHLKVSDLPEPAGTVVVQQSGSAGDTIPVPPVGDVGRPPRSPSVERARSVAESPRALLCERHAIARAPRMCSTRARIQSERRGGSAGGRPRPAREEAKMGDADRWASALDLPLSRRDLLKAGASPELLEHQSKPNCEIPPSDRLPGAIPDRAQLMYERECYKTAETVVRTKLQLLQDAIASTIKALNDAAASRTLQPAEGGEQGAPAPANDAAIAPKAAASAAKSSEATGTAGDRRDAKSEPSANQGVEPPDQHRRPTPSARLSVNLSSREGDVPKSSSLDAAIPERAQTPNVSAQSKPVGAAVKAVACQTSKPAGHGSWAWRVIDGRKCWYEGAVGMDKSLLHWLPFKEVRAP